MLKSLARELFRKTTSPKREASTEHPAISVVIAAYNSPPGMSDLIESLDRQSLSQEKFEVIIVNDGSTDDTLERLYDFAATRPNYKILSIENSGWPSRPRNTAVAVARGDFVFFCDHDDYIFPEAFERMSELARQTNCDVLHPKEVVSGWSAPGWNGWQGGNMLIESLADSDVQCITPHKLYKTEFILRNKIHFPEDMARLEDFSFNAQVWAKAKRVVSLSDYPCYKWIIYDNNSHKASYDFDAYWKSFVNSILPILDMSESDSSKAVLLKRWYRSRILERLGAIYATYSPEYRNKIDQKFQELLPLFPESIDSGLSYADRVRSALLRKGAHLALLELAQLDAGARMESRTLDAKWVNGSLLQNVSVTIVNADKSHFMFENKAGAVNRVFPASVAAHFTDEELENIALRPSELGLEFAIRSRQSSVDWVVPGSRAEVSLPDDGTTGPLVLIATSLLDPKSAAFGSPLEDGIWDCFARIEGVGLTVTQRVAVRQKQLHPALLEGRAVIPYSTQDGFLALDVGATYRTLVGSAQPKTDQLMRESDESIVFLKNVHAVGNSSKEVYLELKDGTQATATLKSRSLRANLIVDCGPTVDLAGSRAVVDGRRSAPLF